MRSETTTETTLYISQDDFYNGIMDDDLKAATSIVFEEGVTFVPAGFGESCPNVEKVTFPDTLERIGNDAFAAKDRIKEVNIPEGTRSELPPIEMGGI